ncbi:MAG: GNAT family N-acetyltransferase [Bacteroidetes bacterium]|nr:GNAT family N-acetyltransferase [Bacteroidota bacterium]
MEIKIARSEQDYLNCLEVLKHLRPHLTTEILLNLISEMEKESYTLIYAEENGNITSACGFRYLTTLFEGRFIYIDDLTTAPEFRGKGYAGALFDYVVEKAKSEGLNAVHLDSGHQRYDAHRLYLNKKMKIVYHHFRLGLKE